MILVKYVKSKVSIVCNWMVAEAIPFGMRVCLSVFFFCWWFRPIINKIRTAPPPPVNSSALSSLFYHFSY